MAKTRGKVLNTFESTPDEQRRIKHYARLHGLPVATYVRMRALTPIDREGE